MTDTDAFHFSNLLDQSSRPLAKWTLAEHLERDPQLSDRFGDNWKSQWEGALVTRLHYLAQAIALDEPGIFTESVQWLGDAFRAREVDEHDLRTSLQCMHDVILQHLSVPQAQRAADICNLAAEQLSLSDRTEDSLAAQALDTTVLRYLESLLTGDQTAARDLCLDALNQGRTLKEVLLNIIQPAQAELGRMWHMDEVSIADEHAATAVTDSILTILSDRATPAPSNGRTVLATTVGGEQHAIGLRMVAILFEVAGWVCKYAGANMPQPAVVEAVTQHKADLVAISCTSTLHLRSVLELIGAIRTQASAMTPILVGGRPFIAFPGLWEKVDADEMARDADEAVRIGTELTDARDAENSD